MFKKVISLKYIASPEITEQCHWTCEKKIVAETNPDIYTEENE